MRRTFATDRIIHSGNKAVQVLRRSKQDLAAIGKKSAPLDGRIWGSATDGQQGRQGLDLIKEEFEQPHPEYMQRFWT